MSEKIRFGAVSPESTYSKKRSLRIRAALAGVVFVAGGCNFGDTPTTNSTEGPFGGFEPVRGACETGSVDSLEIKEHAENCLDTYDGEVALVNFVLAPEDAKNLAADAAEIIETSTDGMIQPTIEVIPASQEAIAAFEAQIADDGCVDGNSLEDYASHAADATMDLTQYITIAAVTNAMSCTENVKGSTNGEYSRYIEVFEVADDIAALQANNGKYEIEENGETRYVPNVSITLAHEILHNFTLGHFGNLDEDAKMNDYLGRPIDLSAYVQEAKYIEYGSDNVMGSPSHVSPGFDLTPFQLYLLEWPQRQLEQETRITALDLAEQAITFNGEDDVNSIAVLELNAASFSTPEVAEGFDRLIFEPQLSGDGRIWAVKVFLVSSHDHIAFAGHLYENGAHQLEVHDGMVTVEVTGEAVNLSYEAAD